MAIIVCVMSNAFFAAMLTVNPPLKELYYIALTLHITIVGGESSVVS